MGINKYFSDRFKHTSDKDQHEVFEYWKEPVGKFTCDCGSVAIRLKRNDVQFKDWDYWLCKMNGEGHCILVSPDGTKMIDNNVREVITVNSYKSIYKITELHKAPKWKLWAKFTLAWFVKQWLRIK